MDKDIIFKKILHYCNYQERCEKDIITKLDSFGVGDADKNKILKILEEEGFIDNERYCRSFVNSKVHLKKWGINKLRVELIFKGIDNNIIDKTLKNIDTGLYRENLIHLLKEKKINEPDSPKRTAKLAQYAIGKGYQTSLVWDVLKELENH